MNISMLMLLIAVAALTVAAINLHSSCAEYEAEAQKQNKRLVDLEVKAMWDRVNDMKLVEMDQAIFVCAALTRIRDMYGFAPHANINVSNENGEPKFITVGPK